MRSAIAALILAVPGASLTGQRPAVSQPARAAVGESLAAEAPAGATAAAQAPPAVVQLSPQAIDSLRKLVDSFRRDPQGVDIPSSDQVAYGGTTVQAGRQVNGPVVVAGGPLHVFGTVNGDAVAIGSDVIIHPGGRVTGNAVSALGQVTLLGGTVDGELRQLGGAIGSIPAPAIAKESSIGATKHALALACSWLLILLLIGLGVLLFAGNYLDGVVESLEGRFGRSFWAGVAAQLALLPVLGLLVAALAVTIIGILLIPFAIVAFVLAVAGLITLGFLAVARITGESVAPSGRRRYSAQAVALRALVIGVSLYMGLWVLAAAFTWAPVIESVLRGVAVAITWVAATAGLGAAVLSRGGTRRQVTALTPAAAVNDEPWQTPTPLPGVVPARRPTPTASARER